MRWVREAVDRGMTANCCSRNIFGRFDFIRTRVHKVIFSSQIGAIMVNLAAILNFCTIETNFKLFYLLVVSQQPQIYVE